MSHITAKTNQEIEDGDEVFLGPKMSFASASAARQATKGGSQDVDEGRKFDRFAPRDKDGYRDREGRENDPDRRRDRARDLNGNELESKQRYRTKQSVDEDEERAARFKNRPLTGKEEDPKRALRGAGRGKFDQPWFRDATRETPAEDAAEAKSGWREEKPRRTADKEWSRGQRLDDDPGWELPGQTNEPAAKTMDDFQKWKENMKASDNAGTPSGELAPLPAAEAHPGDKPKMMTGSFFGNLGAVEDMSLEAAASKQTKDKKGKSRFQSFFGATGEPLQPEQREQPQAVEQTLPQHHPPPSNNDEAAAFDRMMAMLRMGGTGSQGPGPQLFSAPPSQPSDKRSSQGAPPGLSSFFDSNPGSPPLSTSRRPQPAPTPPSQPASRPHPGPASAPTPDRNSEFLLNLMKSQQPRTPFTEGQIYGQGYERKTPENGLDRFAPPPMPRSRGPPSHFYNEPPFANNGNADSRLGPDAQSPQRNSSHEARQAKEQQRFPPGMPPFDQPPPHMFNGGRPQSPPRMPPPPGFAGRPPPSSSQHLPPGPPPGFFGPQFPPQHMNQQSGMPGGGPLRGPMPPQAQQQGPPAFFNGPPGLPPGMGHGPPAGGQRRSGGMPPGFDVFGGGVPGPNGRGLMGHGGPPPPPLPGQQQQGPPQGQGGYAHYMQQMGAGVYKGT
ncbi:hypothetical protein FH972_026581 [Carpinus fangiana]|uniref:Uncharacterized protein n=1 Tax=Carpinus fangiana TaxID=176857 RepID=A0A5N6L4E7_9ROSI|nr:hypothetical protein FH972_026581 [Carpinus fangiana]